MKCQGSHSTGLRLWPVPRCVLTAGNDGIVSLGRHCDFIAPPYSVRPRPTPPGYSPRVQPVFFMVVVVVVVVVVAAPLAVVTVVETAGVVDVDVECTVVVVVGGAT